MTLTLLITYKILHIVRREEGFFLTLYIVGREEDIFTLTLMCDLDLINDL